MRNVIRAIAVLGISAILGPAFLGLDLRAQTATEDTGVAPPSGVAITISSIVPDELNPYLGGAPTASPAQAAAFVWQEFIALNWPAGPQQGKIGQRDTPHPLCRFGDPLCNGPTAWETFRGKVEIFPGAGRPPGYPGTNDPSYGYDALPEYHYQVRIPACDPDQANDRIPWVNLDETSQITLDNMYSGSVHPNNSPGNSQPQLIRFLAKGNRAEYVYVTGNSSRSDTSNQWWYTVLAAVVTATKAFLAQYMASPPAGSSTMVSLPYGTIEMKAGWRPLTGTEVASGRFHMQRVRFYEAGKNAKGYCYRDATWGLVALHVIQKTPSAPFFIYATFEQTDNILTAAGAPVEDVDGNLVGTPPATATTPQECLIDPKPPAGPPDEVASSLGSIILTSNPKTCKPLKVETYCDKPGARIYYREAPSAAGAQRG